jgi:hypothetical protein
MLALSSVALARQAPATIRIEGLNRTLLGATAVSTNGAAVRKGGHSCPGTSGAGALNRATRGHWSGKWFSGLGFEVFTVLGETDKFTTTNSYWELFVNNVAASVGMCGVHLRHGEQLLFAAVPANGIEYPLVLTAPRSALVGHPFTVRVTWINAKGKPKPLAGASVGGKHTNSHGIVHISPTHAGTLVLRTTKRGYIRTEAIVHVAG